MVLTVGSLFSGIGGIDLGLERAGMESRWFVEWDAHCQNVLRRHWPGLPVYGDITAVDWGGVEPVDVLAGGFPCQPLSTAGRRKAQDDERWLWPEFARAIRALRPRYILVENVANLLAVNGGTAMGEVIGDLAASGYDVQWDCIPAESVGALHERDRLWIVAYAPGAGHPSLSDERQESTSIGTATATDACRSFVADSDSAGCAIFQGRGAHEELSRFRAANRAGRWHVEPDVGRVADGIPHRVDRLRSLGNAVVPQVVEWIGRRIVAFDEEREVRAA